MYDEGDVSDISVSRDVPVPMRDGTELATDIYRPADGEPAPTLVHRIPYDKSFAWYVGSLMFNPLTAVERGYAVVVQDTRGRFASAGEWTPFHNEAADGYDTVEWAADQPWSDGRVGVYGSSYMGVTTLQAAVADPPHLEAAVAYLTGANYHDGWAYSGGAFELGFNLHWALGLSWDRLERADLAEYDRIKDDLAAVHADPASYAEHRPLRSLPGVSEALPAWDEWLSHPEYDDYWADVDVTERAGEISVPLLHVTGWYDNFLRGHLDLQAALEAEGDADHRFVVGPWDHGAYLSSTPSQVGDRRFGPEATGGPSFMSGRTLDWFDHHLRGEPLPEDRRTGVRYFDFARETWSETPSWPPAADTQRLYFGSDGDANGRTGDGTLLEEPPEAAPPDSYVYDPTAPVPSVGGRTLMPEMATAGIRDRSTVDEREDVLAYTSPGLTAPLSIAGPVSVTLHAASSARDTDFTATLVDVAPDGYCTPVAEGILRARYRNGTSDPEPLSPGEVYELEIDLWAVAHTFEPGHRIRVSVSSSNFPRFDPHPNVYEPLADVPEDGVRTATQRVYHDADHPSSLSLPVTDGGTGGGGQRTNES